MKSCYLLASLTLCLALVACSAGTARPPAPTALSTPAPAPASTSTATPSPSAVPDVSTQPPATATAEQRVVSADGLAELVVPPGALPAGVSPADLHIVARDPAAAGITAGGQPPLAVYAFEPDGLVFAAPAQLRVTLPMPADHSLPLLLSVSGGKSEWLAAADYTLDAEASTVSVTVPVAHFSSVSLVLGIFTVSLQDPPSQPLGKPFDVPLVVARVRTVITTTAEGSDVITTTSTAPWTLTGELKGARTLAPRTISGAPNAQNVPGHQFTLSPVFTCKTAGDATVSYKATLNAETSTGGFDAAANYPIDLTTRTFKCLGAGTTEPPAGTGRPPMLTGFKADFKAPLFSTFYEVVATDPENKGLKYYWSLSETCGSFTWDGTGGSAKATWAHPHPPCAPVKDHHPGEITVRVVAASGLESLFIYRGGSASADIDLTKPTPTPTPTPKP